MITTGKHSGTPNPFREEAARRAAERGYPATPLGRHHRATAHFELTETVREYVSERYSSFHRRFLTLQTSIDESVATQARKAYFDATPHNLDATQAQIRAAINTLPPRNHS